MGITRGLIRVGIASPVLRGIATRLRGGHCEVCGRQSLPELPRTSRLSGRAAKGITFSGFAAI